MGCVSSTFLEDDDGGSVVVGTAGLGHHIVSLTSTTYGLLATLDLPSAAPSHPQPQQQQPEVINSWELMAGLDPIAPPKHSLSQFEPRCPPGGERSVVLYTTTLRGIRKTFEDCNAVRSAIEGLGVAIKERDVSMDLGFREELRELLKGRSEVDGASINVPQLFVKGRYIGGAEAVLRIHEEGGLAELVEGMPRAKIGGVCDGCGGVGFLPCFMCFGSRKVLVGGVKGGGGGGEKVVRCWECNENGLVLCPICC